MSRVLLLLIFMVWMSVSLDDQNLIPPPAIDDLLGFLGGYVLLITVMGLWARLLARRVSTQNLYRSVRRFNRTMEAARFVVPIWLGVGVFLLQWKDAVHYILPAPLERIETPGVLLGTLPAFLAWMGLWWAQFPADRALREQNLLIQLDQAMPVHAPPEFRSYFSANLRLQLLFTIVPVLLILLTKDLVGLAMNPWLKDMGPATNTLVEGLVMFGAGAMVFLVAPEILRRVLHTAPLPDSPLRRRLDAMCARHNLRYRDILLWHTQGNMGNAAVMGVLPRFRYVLLSDLLIETMTDEQIEAVFAHELGHIVHRHMLWYVLFVIILMLTLSGPGAAVETYLNLNYWVGDAAAAALAMGAGCVLFLVTFGYISRRFERQADVFAARTMEQYHAPTPDDSAHPAALVLRPSFQPVGPYGATLFASALERVAVVNNIPVSARSWCHGSIAKRMAYLHSLKDDPTHTHRFDRRIRRLYWALVLALLVAGTWVVVAGQV